MANIVEKIDPWVKIKRILISTSDKKGLDKFIPKIFIINPEIIIYSTGGTYTKLYEIFRANNLPLVQLIQVSDYTGHPETQGGLVKTLDFRIYLGLLTETYNDDHQTDLERTDAKIIDMVIVNLYPFKDTIKKANVTVEIARGQIDIGGPCMLRASAKNHLRVASVVDPNDYDMIAQEMGKKEGCLSFDTRFHLAQKTFRHTADYDNAVADYLESKSAAEARSCYNQ